MNTNSIQLGRKRSAIIIFVLGLASLGLGRLAFAGEPDAFIASGTAKYRAKEASNFPR